jgi:L-malate glycosyltransferase
VSFFHPFASGAERQALVQGAELVKRGHIVHVVTRAVPGYPVDEEEHQGIFIHRCIKTVTRGPLFGLSFVKGVIAALTRLRTEIDLIHTHQALWEAVATGLARPLLSGTPTLIQPASAGYYGEAEELGRTKGARLLRRAILANTAFAAISAEIEREWRALGVSERRIRRMVSGVDAETFRPGSSSVEGELLPRPRVIFTGRLHPQKNLPLLFEAWTEVARRSPANLILVGPGTDRQQLTDLAGTLGISDRVQFVGAVDNPADYLRAADLFVLPSVAEGMSNSLLEAMATALPCVVSGIAGNTDLITDHETGRLVMEPTDQSWSKCLLELLENPDDALRLGAAARQRIDREFAHNVVVDQYVELYQQMIAGDWPGNDASGNDQKLKAGSQPVPVQPAPETQVNKGQTFVWKPHKAGAHTKYHFETAEPGWDNLAVVLEAQFAKIGELLTSNYAKEPYQRIYFDFMPDTGRILGIPCAGDITRRNDFPMTVEVCASFLCDLFEELPESESEDERDGDDPVWIKAFDANVDLFRAALLKALRSPASTAVLGHLRQGHPVDCYLQIWDGDEDIEKLPV